MRKTELTKVELLIELVMGVLRDDLTAANYANVLRMNNAFIEETIN